MTPVLRHKAGATFHEIAPGGFRLLAALDAATVLMGRDLEITAGTNDHDVGRHPLGEAYDLSVQGLLPQDIRRLVDYLNSRLGPAFSAWYEAPTPITDSILAPVSLVNHEATAPHIHCQVRKGVTFPAQG